jgi:hypothetical protein
VSRRLAEWVPDGSTIVAPASTSHDEEDESDDTVEDSTEERTAGRQALRMTEGEEAHGAGDNSGARDEDVCSEMPVIMGDEKNGATTADEVVATCGTGCHVHGQAFSTTSRSGTTVAADDVDASKGQGCATGAVAAWTSPPPLKKAQVPRGKRTRKSSGQWTLSSPD